MLMNVITDWRWFVTISNSRMTWVNQTRIVSVAQLMMKAIIVVRNT